MTIFYIYILRTIIFVNVGPNISIKKATLVPMSTYLCMSWNKHTDKEEHVDLDFKSSASSIPPCKKKRKSSTSIDSR